jgi:hypothetical protein
MVRNDPTKHRRGDITARLGLSACILIPPLLMAAGLAVFDSLPPRGGDPQAAAAQAPESIIAKTVTSAGRSDAGSSFALANPEGRAGITEKRPELPTGSIDQAAAEKNSARYFGPASVALVRVRKVNEQPEVADLEDAAPTVTPPRISRRLPAVARSFPAFHARGRVGRQKPAHTAYSPKHQRGAAPSHVASSHKAPRPTLRQHAQRR